MAKSSTPTPAQLMDSIMEGIKSLDGVNVEFDTNVTCIPTGIDLLDYIMGGGVPLGKLSTITGQAGGGKSLPMSAKILTPTGWKLMKDIKVGDIVCGPNYKNTKVIGVYPQGELQTYEVGFLNGVSCRCSEDHLWAVKCSYNKKHKNDVDKGWKIKSLRELAIGGIHYADFSPKWITPSAGVVKFDTREVPIDPYFIGRYLMEPEVRTDVIAASYANELHELGLDVPEDKLFIPNIYLFNSIENRYKLLAGISNAYYISETVDEDGESKPIRGVDYDRVPSAQLVEDIADLFRSLGGTGSVTYEVDIEASEAKHDFVCYDEMCVRGEYPFGLTLKEINEGKRPHRRKRVGRTNTPTGEGAILTIEKDVVEECQCIKVDSEDGLFITDEFIVTHNTTIAAQYIVGFQNYDPNSMAFYLDIEQGLSKDRLIQLGCDPTRTKLMSQYLTMESVYKVINKILAEKIKAKQKDVPYIIIWDSESATPTEKAMEAEESKSIMGEHARNFQFVLNKLIPNLAACNTSLIVISQLRNKITMDPYAPKSADLTFGNQKITGGSAAEFLPFQLAFIRTKGKTGPEGKNENCIPIIGQANEIYFKKNKNFTPDIPIEMVIDYDSGYSNFWTKERLLRTKKCFKAAGPWQTLEGCDIKFRKAEVKDVYDKDPKFKEAFDKVYEEKKKELLSMKSTKKKKELDEDLSDEDTRLLEALEGAEGDVEVSFEDLEEN